MLNRLGPMPIIQHNKIIINFIKKKVKYLFIIINTWIKKNKNNKKTKWIIFIEIII